MFMEYLLNNFMQVFACDALCAFTNTLLRFLNYISVACITLVFLTALYLCIPRSVC